jgi:8-oxo-dGTP diphosphatase
MRLTIKCSIAILENNHQSYLFSKRKKLPYINYFEFPGGKLNENEKPYDALLRECKEEIGIIITDAEYINTIKQRYLDFDVILYIFKINTYSGTIRSQENQEILFLDPYKMTHKFLQSTFRILKVLKLQRNIIISKIGYQNISSDILNTKNNYMLRIRSFDYTKDEYEKIISKASMSCKREMIQLIIDHPFENNSTLDFSGIHYTSSNLLEADKINESRYFLSASCHNLDEVSIANNLNLDFIIVSPVLKSKYKNKKCLGWEGFKKISEYANMPTFALGGINPKDLPISINNSGYGVSGISNFWKK